MCEQSGLNRPVIPPVLPADPNERQAEVGADVIENGTTPLEEPHAPRPALLAGEEGEIPDRHIFRGTD
ncbi:hypothetical protein GCM10010446_55120 [Streptomyces enissocaesilis]|uniref:Uncharacterized protein n=1 Tax=Streptomyces enissocaesilis TaxID=332589 RepID=A0ABN3XK10_9ACTN